MCMFCIKYCFVYTYLVENIFKKIKKPKKWYKNIKKIFTMIHSTKKIAAFVINSELFNMKGYNRIKF